ncbi:MAG: hypothetical protein IJU76_15215 [Desulfovibrionaceae bacterium]|nr:hypothetical protein [Desulfovibrionaceae bacterium]
MRKNKFKIDLKNSFLYLSKNRRKKLKYQLLKKIILQNYQYKDKRKFFSNIYMPYSQDTMEFSWCACNFPSKKYPDIIYNAYLENCNFHIKEEVYWKIFNTVMEECKNYKEDTDIMIPITENRKKKYFVQWNEITIDKYDNRTRFEEINRREKLWYFENENKYIIHESVFLHSKNKIYDIFAPLKEKNQYILKENGIYLNAIIDTNNFTVERINKFIEEFYENNEIAYSKKESVPQEHLCYKFNELSQNFGLPLDEKFSNDI